MVCWNQADDMGLSQDQSWNHSQDPSEPFQEISISLPASSIPSGNHISPFDQLVGGNGQPVEPSNTSDLPSLSAPITSLVQEGGPFPNGYSEYGHQSGHMNQFSSLCGFQEVNSVAPYESAGAPLDERGLGGSVNTAKFPPLRFISPNIHPSTQYGYELGLSQSAWKNSAGHETQTRFDQTQLSSGQIASRPTRGTKRPHLSEQNPSEGDGFTEPRHAGLSWLNTGGLSGQISAGERLSPMNQAQNLLSQPQRSHSLYLSRPGQIYERVTHQAQIPFPSRRLYPGANIALNPVNNGEPVTAKAPPFSHSISTQQFVPIQPAASQAQEIQDTSPVKAQSGERNCDTCGKNFRTKKDLLRHVGRMHILKGRHPCPRTGCNQSFAEAHKLKRHINTVHLKVRPFQCPVCDAAFGEKGNMVQHFRKAHAGESSNAKRV